MEEKVLEILKETFELDSVDKTCSQTSCEAWDSMGQLNLTHGVPSFTRCL